MKTAVIHQQFLLSTGVSTDTRDLKPGNIFFALKGDNFNGNQFALQALEKGASYIIVDEKQDALKNTKHLLVDNCLEQLQKLATFHRKYLDIPVIAITGSNGKTTTKELLQTVLSKKHKVTATKGNLNNHIGVPLSLLKMNQNTEIGIIEMGANHPGEIDFLSNIALPDYGFITNFGKAHLQGFGSLEGVIQAKSELYHHLKSKNKLLFLNMDDEKQFLHTAYKHTFGFGAHPKAQVRIEYPETASLAEVTFNKSKFKSQLSGAYNAQNIAAALSIGLYFKVSVGEIKEAIANYKPTNNRSQILTKGSNTIYLDAYNANPTSMKASLKHFNAANTNQQKIAILGDMKELGNSSKTEHQVLVNYLEELNISEIYLVGDNFKKTSSSKSNIIKFKDSESLKEHLRLAKIQDYHILIKGSRGMALENTLEVFEVNVPVN